MGVGVVVEIGVGAGVVVSSGNGVEVLVDKPGVVSTGDPVPLGILDEHEAKIIDAMIIIVIITKILFIMLFSFLSDNI